MPDQVFSGALIEQLMKQKLTDYQPNCFDVILVSSSNRSFCRHKKVYLRVYSTVYSYIIIIIMNKKYLTGMIYE